MVAKTKKPGLAGFGNPLRIIILVAAALLGLGFSTNYFFGKDKYNVPRFHEINWNPREVTETLVTLAFADINKLPDSLKQKQISTLNKIMQLLSTKTDTALRAELSRKSSLFIHIRDMAIGNYHYDPTAIDDIPITPDLIVTYVDSGLVKGQITYPVTLKIKRFESPNIFFNKYPGFGLWALLLTMGITFYFILIAGFGFHFTSASANSLYKTHLDYKQREFFILLGSVLVFELAFDLLLLHSKTPQLSLGTIFMRSVGDVFTLANFSGYFAAAFCLVGMIISVLYMNKLKQKCKQEVMKISLVEELRTDIKRRFNTYFVFAAIILSLAIFTSGVFFSAMNNMEFIKEVSRDQGFSPVNPDMVYLYGILNSFILLLAYLPAKYMLGSLDKLIPSSSGNTKVEEGPEPTGSKTNKSRSASLGKLSTMLTELLITTSPFLASLFQNLLESIFN